MEFELPYPPSVNRYWRKVGNRMLISKAGRDYKRQVCRATRGLLAQPMRGPLAVTIQAAPPDNRTRDLDNLLKAPLDALKGAGIYLDDSQIDEIHLYRVGHVKGGSLTVSVSPLDGPEAVCMGAIREDLDQRAKQLQSELQAVLVALAAVRDLDESEHTNTPLIR